MSSRVTRSAARLSNPSNSASPTTPQPPPQPSSARKRKAPARDPSPHSQTSPQEPHSKRRAKRTKTEQEVPQPEPASSKRKTRAAPAMSSTGLVPPFIFFLTTLTIITDIQNHRTSRPSAHQPLHQARVNASLQERRVVLMVRISLVILTVH
jgi:hypothetical protein